MKIMILPNCNRKKASKIQMYITKMGCAVAVLLLTACNLFIEDEMDWKDDIPVHTGYGYDAPVTENGEFYDLTYQLNSNVNILKDETLKYLHRVDTTDNNWICILDFDLNMPQDLRPVKGEYLLHGICDKLPDGLIHQVIGTQETGGFYKVLCFFTPFEDLFKYIDMDVDLAKGLALQGDNVSEETGEDLHEESQETNVTPNESKVYSKPNRARKEDEVSFAKEYSIALRANTVYTKNVDEEKKAEARIEIKPINETEEDNVLKFKTNGKIRVKKTYGGVVIPFGLSMKNDMVYQANLDIRAGFNISDKIIQKTDILPKNASISVTILGVPVTFKLCLGMVMGFEFDTKMESNLKFRLPLYTEFDRDLFDLTLGWATWDPAIRRDLSKWKLNTQEGYFAASFTAGLDFKVYFDFYPGIGLYSEKLSTRLLLRSPILSVKADAPRVGGNGYGIDISRHEGISLSSEFAAALQLWAPYDQSVVLNDAIDDVAKWQKTIGNAAAWIILQGLDKDAAEEYNKQVNALNDHIKNMKSSVAEKGIYILSTDTVKLDRISYTWTQTWFPTIEEEKNPFSFRKNFKKPGIRNKDLLNIKYTIDKLGILPLLYRAKPCLLITDKYYNFVKLKLKENIYIDRYYKMPQNGLPIEYDIPMDELPEEEDLYAFPGFLFGNIINFTENYFNSDKSRINSSLFAFDRAQLINTKTPPNTRIVSIYNKRNQKLPQGAPGTYKYHRFFTVVVEVEDSHSDRASKVGVRFSKNDNNEYETINRDIRKNLNRYSIDVYKLCENENDLYFDVYPFAARFDGSEGGLVRDGTGTFMGNIPEGYSVCMEGDEEILIEGEPPRGYQAN